MDIIIKELDNDPNEIENVQKFLFNQIKQEFHYGYIPEYHQDIMNMEEYYISPSRNNFYIAYDKETGEIIGTIGVRSYDKNFKQFQNIYSNDNTSSIWRLFVDKRYRRCGLASKLFKIAENFSCKYNYDKIYLHTHKTLKGALDFWKKMGFNITIDEGNKLQTIHMDKIINNIKFNKKFIGYQFAIKI